MFKSILRNLVIFIPLVLVMIIGPIFFSKFYPEVSSRAVSYICGAVLLLLWGILFIIFKNRIFK